MKKLFLGIMIATVFLGCSKDKEDEEPVNKIIEALSTSLTDYENASNGSWVNITASEYDKIASVVNGTSKQGASDVKMNTPTTGSWGENYTIGGNNNTAKVPASSYIIAWSLRTGLNTTSSEGSKLKVSASQNSGYANYGSALPDMGTIAENSRVYFVLKNPNSTTPASPSYLAVYTAEAFFLGENDVDDTELFFGVGDVTSPENSWFKSSTSQVISTKTKQW